MQRKVKLPILFTILALCIFALTAFVSCQQKPAENVTVTVQSEEIRMEVGQTQKLGVSVDPIDALDKQIEWESSNEKVATVKDGMITAVGKGEATITATTNGKSDSCKVIVEEKGQTPSTPNGTQKPNDSSMQG